MNEKLKIIVKIPLERLSMEIQRDLMDQEKDHLLTPSDQEKDHFVASSPEDSKNPRSDPIGTENTRSPTECMAEKCSSQIYQDQNGGSTPLSTRGWSLHTCI